jgi:hypothetical protein
MSEKLLEIRTEESLRWLHDHSRYVLCRGALLLFQCDSLQVCRKGVSCHSPRRSHWACNENTHCTPVGWREVLLTEGILLDRGEMFFSEEEWKLERCCLDTC